MFRDSLSDLREPSVFEVLPFPIPRVSGKLWLTLKGVGFSLNCVVIVSTSAGRQTIPSSRMKIINAELMQVCLVLTPEHEVFAVKVGAKLSN